jgi:hypothetical protein
MMTDQDVDSLLCLAAGYAMWFVGVPEAEMMAALDGIRSDLETRLTEKLGTDVANTIAAAFPGAVVSARRALEAGGTPGVLN